MRVRSEKSRRRDLSRVHVSSYKAGLSGSRDKFSVQSKRLMKLPNADFAKRLPRRLHLDSLTWLLEKGIFGSPVARKSSGCFKSTKYKVNLP